MGNIFFKVMEYIFVIGPTAHLKFGGFDFFATSSTKTWMFASLYSSLY